MKNNGIFIGVIGLISMVISRAGIFKKEIEPGLKLYEENTTITYPLLIIGIILVLLGAYKFSKNFKK